MMKSINRPELVREYNMGILRKALYSSRQASRQQLSRLTGISTVTLGGLLRDLIESGEAYEGDQEPSDGGRPIHTYCYNPSVCSGLFLLVQYEGDRYILRTGAVNRYGELIHEEKHRAARLDRSHTYKLLKKLMDTDIPVKAVAAGLPGVGIDEYIHDGSNFLSLEALHDIEAETGIPVQWENDINLAAVGYARRRIPRDETLAYFYLMKGCPSGAAVYINGSLHRGKGRFAGEFLSVMSGVKWEEAETENPEAICENIIRLLLPYISVIAPNRVVIASDYIKPAHLRQVRDKVISITGEPYCPELALTKDFSGDYTSGVRQMVLDNIALT